MPTKSAIVDTLLERHGQTFASELGVDASDNQPSTLFRLLCFALLASTRISANIAMQAAQALDEQGWTTARKLLDADWQERVDTLNRAGYARYDESTSTMLAETAGRLIDEYGGDLRELRRRTGRDPGEERRLLKDFKGLGDVGVDIFMREVQAAWEELYPFTDKLTLKASRKLDLGNDGETLARLVRREDYPRLSAALVRTHFAKDDDEILEAA